MRNFFMAKIDDKGIGLNSKTASGVRGISLKELAAHTGLSQGTLSVVLNNTERASSIPQITKERIFKAALELNYRPNYFARSLRANRSFTIGVIAAELSDSYCSMILRGIEAGSTEQGYFYLNTSHLHRKDLLAHNSHMLIERQVEGIITIQTPIRFECHLPIVSIAGHEEIEGVTNVILNHQKAAELGIEHLFALGHRQIALIKGQDFSSDSKVRSETIAQAAHERGIPIDEELITQLEGINPSPEVGYIATKKLFTNKKRFTAIFAFNDMSAIGAIRALKEVGLRVPEDVSVLGFDNLHIAAYYEPSLTTIRQPLFEMGKLSAQTLLKNLSIIENKEEIPKFKMVEPELIVRNSTAKVKNFKP
jgi:DNA-binding LacI/PurR family transcriptional regulator